MIWKLPDLTVGMLTLLGISQVGYIANKAISYNTTPGTPDTAGSDIAPSITDFSPDQIDFDRDTSIAIIGSNFGQDPNPQPKGTIFLDGRGLTTESWTPERIEAKLPEDKAAATAAGFSVPSTVKLEVQHYLGRRSLPAQKEVRLI